MNIDAWIERGEDLKREYPEGSPWYQRGVELARGEL